MLVRLILCVYVALVGACSTSPNSLDQPTSRSRFFLASDAFAQWKAMTSDIDGGLRRGDYIAKFEDAGGTYYEGPEKCMVLSQSNSQGQWFGGIWIPKDGNMKNARLWRYAIGMGKSRYSEGLVGGIMDKIEEGNLQKIRIQLPDQILKAINISRQ